jgi:MSHA biogenesis protein MshQ
VVTSQYDGAVAASVSCVLPASGCVAGALSPGGFSASGGTLVSNTASFPEAGAIAVSFVDSNFATVDSDDNAASCAGFHVCSSAINVGRFVPDHYDVASIQSPVFRTFGTTCASRSFTYVGQEFGFATLPRARITARNAAGGTTANAKGTLWKLSPNGHFSASWRCQKTGGASCDMVGITSAGFSAGNLVSNSDGTGDFTWPTNLMVPSGVKYKFERSDPPPIPFDAELGLGIVIRDSSEAGNCGLASCLILDAQPVNPPTWGMNIAFDAGNAFRQGRLRLSNANGSELLPLPVSLTAQYWNGQGWVANTADQCTALSAPALTFFAQTADNHLASGETTASFNATLVAGAGNLRLSAPGTGNFGYLDITVTAPAWLRHNWDGTDQGGDGDLLDDNPRARASFGKRGGSSKVILRRELY